MGKNQTLQQQRTRSGTKVAPAIAEVEADIGAGPPVSGATIGALTGIITGASAASTEEVGRSNATNATPSRRFFFIRSAPNEQHHSDLVT